MSEQGTFNEAAASLLGRCVETVAAILSQALGTAVAAAGGPQAAEGEGGAVRLVFHAAGAAAGTMTFALGPGDARWLARTFMGMPVEGEDAAELAGDDREALNELWRQVMGELAARVRMGAEQVRFELAPEGETPAAGPAAKMEFDGGGRRIRLQVVLSGGLEQGIAPPAAEAEEANAAEAAEATPAPPLTGEVTGQSRVSAAFPNLRPENLELLLDVELPATLRFGQKQMRLSEILQLSAGAVIDLDREVQEPVELLVDGKLIARGEAVIVDGNYGLRVTELATPRERLEAIP